MASDAGSAEDVSAFDVCDDDVEPNDHHFVSQTSVATRTMMAAVRREMVALRKGLLEGDTSCVAPIVVRAYSSRSDLFRAMVVGPPDTPYAAVPFFFDIALPSTYPREPPLVHFHANYVGNERLNPNLYVDGKVCLSLLGTWAGPSWDPQRSSLLQVLVSLQGLVLVEEPYYNEPGHECDAGTEQGRQASTLYNENARLLALRAAVNISHTPPQGFQQIVSGFFARHGPSLVEECEQRATSGACSEGFRKVLLKSLLPRLRERFSGSSTQAAPSDTASAAKPTS
jgi:ubiquitin-conjugating enzyme E2 O